MTPLGRPLSSQFLHEIRKFKPLNAETYVITNFLWRTPVLFLPISDSYHLEALILFGDLRRALSKIGSAVKLDLWRVLSWGGGGRGGGGRGGDISVCQHMAGLQPTAK